MSGVVSPLEITWTLVAGVGLVFSLLLMYSGWIDLADLQMLLARIPPEAVRWGPRWWVAVSAIVSNALYVLIYAGFLTIGLLAMQWPPPPPTTEQARSTVWVGWLLVTIEILLVGVQAWHLYVRRRIDLAPPVPRAWRRFPA